jgi:hypothetical protein
MSWRVGAGAPHPDGLESVLARLFGAGLPCPARHPERLQYLLSLNAWGKPLNNQFQVPKHGDVQQIKYPAK